MIQVLYLLFFYFSEGAQFQITVADTDHYDSVLQITVADTDHYESVSQITVADTVYYESVSQIIVADTDHYDSVLQIIVADTVYYESVLQITVADTVYYESVLQITVADTAPKGAFIGHQVTSHFFDGSTVSDQDHKHRQHCLWVFHNLRVNKTCPTTIC